MSVSAAYSASCRGVEGSRSSPRSTSVMPIRASSTGLTNGYSGAPLARTITKSGTEPAGLDLLVGGEGLEGVPGRHQLLGPLAVDVGPLGLPVGAVRPADLGALVPLQAQPAQAVD